MTKKITIGIDIGTSLTRVVVMEWTKENQFPNVIGVGLAETSGLRSGYINNVKQVSQSVRQAIILAEKASGIKIRRACVAIETINLSSAISHGSTIISKADKEITHLDISKAISQAEEGLDLNNRKIIHTIPISFKLDGKEIYGRPEGLKGIKLEVKTLFVTCLKQNIEDLVSALAEIDVEVVDIIATPIASSLLLLSEKQKIAGCALLDIGAETVSLAVFEDNLLISLQIFSIGGIDIYVSVFNEFHIFHDLFYIIVYAYSKCRSIH